MSADLGGGVRRGIWRLTEPRCDKTGSVDPRHGAMCPRSMGWTPLPSQPDGHEHDKPADLSGRPGSGSMSELATRPVIPRELTPSRARRDGRGNIPVAPL